MLSKIKKTLWPVKQLIRDFGLYINHKATGTTYTEYYADRMDRHIRRRSNWGLLMDRRFQVEYLVAKGLTANSTLLDYGCGAVAAGLHMIEFLNCEKYTGADVSVEAISEGGKRVEKANLSIKNPRLVHIPGGSLTRLGLSTYDYIWSYSVLTHMPPVDIENLLRNVQPLMSAETKFFADFALGNKISHKRFKDWYYPKEWLIETAGKVGLQCQIQSDWKSPEDPDNLDTMACFMKSRD